MSFRYSSNQNDDREYENTYNQFRTNSIYNLKYNIYEHQYKIKIIGFYVENDIQMMHCKKVINNISNTSLIYYDVPLSTRDYTLIEV